MPMRTGAMVTFRTAYSNYSLRNNLSANNLL
jgi:hypothetical protein